MYKLPRVLLQAPAHIVASEWKTNHSFSSRGYQDFAWYARSTLNFFKTLVYNYMQYIRTYINL